MLKKISYLLATFFTGAIMLAPAAVIAHEETSSSSNKTAATTSDDTNDTTEPSKEKLERSARIAKSIASFKVKLGATEKARIKLKCVGAQGAVGKLHTKFGNSVTVRTQAYTELQKNLDKLVEKLKAKSVDTATLEQQITELKAKITTYTTDLAAYKLTLSDLKEVDCKTDPDAFQAALLAARSAHEKLVTDVVAIRSYLVGTIKPTLQTIKKSLETESSDKTKESDTNSTDTNNSTSGGTN